MADTKENTVPWTRNKRTPWVANLAISFAQQSVTPANAIHEAMRVPEMHAHITDLPDWIIWDKHAGLWSMTIQKNMPVFLSVVDKNHGSIGMDFFSSLSFSRSPQMDFVWYSMCDPRALHIACQNQQHSIFTAQWETTQLFKEVKWFVTQFSKKTWINWIYSWTYCMHNCMHRLRLSSSSGHCVLQKQSASFNQEETPACCHPQRPVNKMVG